MLDDTISLSIENVVKEAKDLGKAVFVVMKTQVATEKLKRIGVQEILSDDAFTDDRTIALEKAIAALKELKVLNA